MKTHDARSLEDIRSSNAAGDRINYLFFWGHTPAAMGTIGKECLSQWYDASFTVDSILYRTAEHFMMAEKARLFSDHGTVEKILESTSPREAKALGRNVENFDESVWIRHRVEIVVAGNLHKFSQNEKLKQFILASHNRVLVEASPFDRIWGIGLAADDPDVENPRAWRGLNLLGFSLMEVRRLLTA